MEYKLLSRSIHGITSTEKDINLLAQDGWEVVCSWGENWLILGRRRKDILIDELFNMAHISGSATNISNEGF